MFVQMGLVSRRVAFKPLLTLLQRRKRLAFARKYRNYIVADWQKVIWSDGGSLNMQAGSMPSTSCQWRPNPSPDGAPPQAVVSTRNWLRRNGIREFNHGLWPPSSPDLNTIEHVWPIVGRLICGQTFRDREELWTALQSAFESVTSDQICKLVSSMPDRIQAVLMARGGSTR